MIILHLMNITKQMYAIIGGLRSGGLKSGGLMSGGLMSGGLKSAHRFQEKTSWCQNEQVCQGRKSVKPFERLNGLDTVLYKNIPLPL